jgi:hypothetical protein
MRQTKTALMMLMVCFIAFSSCKKDKSTPKTSVSLTVKVDGVSKTASHVLATYYKSENTLQLMATFSGTENVSLMIQNIKPGSYDIATSNDVIATYGTASDFADTYQGDTGTIVISSFSNGSVSGTFNFVGTNTANASKTITAGTFTTTYISQ